MNSFSEMYRNQKVLVTGNTGFKGSWLSIWLKLLGAEVYGISLDVPTSPAHFEITKLEKHSIHTYADIRNYHQLQQLIGDIQPDFLFHLAAQPLVRSSYDRPLLTLETNIMGTAHILEALQQVNSPCIAVMITSDKCYDNLEWTWGYRETDALGGKDPYSASKGGAELAIKTYFHSFFNTPQSKIKIGVGRAGNVIGGADWATDRIVPDCMRAWSQNQIVEIRRPNATRPWQHVLEPLSGYLVLGEYLQKEVQINGEPYNFGPNTNQNFSVQELIREMLPHWEGAQWKDTSDPHAPHEATLLKLCCDKALHQLAWSPVLNFQETAKMTVDWYRTFYENPHTDMYQYSIYQIEEFTELAKQRGIQWAQ